MEKDRIPQSGRSNTISITRWVESQFSGSNFREQCFAALEYTSREMANYSVSSPEWHAIGKRGSIIGQLIIIEESEPVNLPELEQQQALAA